MHLYRDQFSESYDFPKVEKPSKVLIIASTPRSGSHMLGHALYRTQKFGFPLEYANPSNLAEWRRLLGIDDLRGVLTAIQKKRTSPNGVFSIKLHYRHIKQFGQFDALTKFFPNAYYVLLSRKDLLRQAVSLAIAKQTGVWIHGQKPVCDNPVYNFDNIDNCLRQTILQNSSWRYTLAGSGCNFLDLTFDDVRDDLPGSIRQIARFIGVDLDGTELPGEQVTEKQRGPRNSEWTSRFISDFNKSKELLTDVRPKLIDKVKHRISRVMCR